MRINLTEARVQVRTCSMLLLLPPLLLPDISFQNSVCCTTRLPQTRRLFSCVFPFLPPRLALTRPRAAAFSASFAAGRLFSCLSLPPHLGIWAEIVPRVWAGAHAEGRIVGPPPRREGRRDLCWPPFCGPNLAPACSRASSQLIAEILTSCPQKALLLFHRSSLAVLRHSWVVHVLLFLPFSVRVPNFDRASGKQSGIRLSLNADSTGV